ncbi:MAG: FAD-binding oxidoreductase [Rhodovibrionaceae bacterium]|nr:FAD-binding oxidoreductase [Rhodovibrionaceae bacterium]
MSDDIFTDDFSQDPYWWEEAPRPESSGMVLPKSADVLVVGGGFTGTSAALTLARAGRSVVVCEAGRTGEGASTRNGGMIGSGHRLPSAALIKRYGQEMAMAILKEGVAALEFTSGLIEREGIDCHFQRCGRFRGAHTPALYEAMAREVEQLRRTIALDATLVDGDNVRGQVASDLYCGGAVYNSHGGLHPALFHRGLVARLSEAGGTYVDRCAVTGIAREGDRFHVGTDRGSVAARDVIVATNGYTGAESPVLRRRIVPAFSYMIATEELGESRVRALIPSGRMIVETRADHCYYRPSPDGRRILLGGRSALRGIGVKASARRLHAFLLTIFPELEGVRISHSWRGQLAFTRDHVPHIGVRNGVHHALGYSGSGVAMAPYLGHRVAQKVLGADVAPSPLEKAPMPVIPGYWGAPWFLPLMDAWRSAQRLAGR